MERALGNIFVRTMHFSKAGEVVQGHEHYFDHVTLVFSGGVRIRYRIGGTVEGEREFWAPHMIAEDGQESLVLIKDNVCHEFTALADNTHCWCVYSHRDPDGTVVENFNGWMKAYWQRPIAPDVIG